MLIEFGILTSLLSFVFQAWFAWPRRAVGFSDCLAFRCWGLVSPRTLLCLVMVGCGHSGRIIFRRQYGCEERRISPSNSLLLYAAVSEFH